MDPNEKKEEIMPREMIATTTTANEKCCVDCKTTKTPLWRSGPSGPKSLCNACGIRHRKRRAAVAAAAAATSTSTSPSGPIPKIRKDGENTSKIKKRANARNGKYDELSVEWRQRLMAFGEGVALFQKQRSQMKKKRQRLGEVEQAAVLLMSLSCGSVLA